MIVIFYPLMEKISLYFHVPFCRRRCGYCDFNTFAGLDSYIPNYVNAVCQEIDGVLRKAPDSLTVHTIYFGGGTPSLLSIDQFQQIFDRVHRSISVEEDAEISLEANPETVAEDYIHKLREIGFTRISFGMQSAAVDDLRVLDRQHRYESVVDAVRWSKQTGFTHINLDLIFGIPGQSRQSWNHTLDQALMFGIDHFSIYSLIVEDGTRLKRWIDKGMMEAADDDLAACMYEDTMDVLGKAGYQQYEISNWSRGEDSRCRHNLQYWRFKPYFGFGAGAHGFLGSIRTENIGAVPEYIQAIRDGKDSEFPASPAACQTVTLTEWDKIQENLMVSLRLTDEGVNLVGFEEHYRVQITELFERQIMRLKRLGLLESFDAVKGLRLTRKGRLLGNQVFAEFVGNEAPEGYEYLDHQ